jgi:hypothetical protein
VRLCPEGCPGEGHPRKNESRGLADAKDLMLQRVLYCRRSEVALGWWLVGGSKHELDVTAVGVGRASHDRLCPSAACCYQAGRRTLGLGLKLK